MKRRRAGLGRPHSLVYRKPRPLIHLLYRLAHGREFPRLVSLRPEQSEFALVVESKVQVVIKLRGHPILVQSPMVRRISGSAVPNIAAEEDRIARRQPDCHPLLVTPNM